MRRTRTAVFVLALGLQVAAGAAAQEAAPASPCSNDKAHQFDFWIGEWEVTAGGQVAGHNSIQPILDGCVLQESWQGATGGAGSSFNFFNPQTAKWHQFWVWRNGTVLDLEGGFADGRMILEGESLDRQGKSILNRVTWTDNPDGTVRHLWEVSNDAGKSWQTAFDGHYKKRG